MKWDGGYIFANYATIVEFIVALPDAMLKMYILRNQKFSTYILLKWWPSLKHIPISVMNDNNNKNYYISSIHFVFLSF